jgi:hypothetical protein
MTREMKMTRLALIRAALLLPMAGLAAPDRAAAQSAPTQSAPVQEAPAQNQLAPAPGENDGRYSFHRIGDGFVRLDSRTGQLAQCGRGPTGWSCKAVPDERAALESEIARLQRENAELKKSLLSRGLDLPGGVVAQAPVPPPVPPLNVPDPSRREPKAPSDVELDYAITFMKNVWRKLVDMMLDLQRDVQRKS